MADKKISDGSLRDADSLEGTDVFEVEKPGTAVQYKTTLADLGSFVLGNIIEKTAEPANPPEGSWFPWMSNGIGIGSDGDILVKVTAGGVTKTITLINFSAVP